LAIAKEFLNVGREKIEAMPNGPAKKEMLKGFVYSETWYEDTQTKIESEGGC
jgi:hypothetical protein